MATAIIKILSSSTMIQIYLVFHGMLLLASANSFHPTIGEHRLHSLHPTSISTTQSEPWSTVRRSAAFIVPRGGAESDKDNENSTFDDIDASNDYDISDEEPENCALERGPPHLFSFLSQKSIVTAMTHYASLLVKLARQTCQAGVNAIFCNKSTEDEDGSPMVHTLFESTAHVFGEMYNAASDLSDENEGRNKEDGHKKRRHRRRKRKSSSYSTKLALACNGGGIDEVPESNHDAAIMQLARQYGATISTDDANKPTKNYESILLSSNTSLSEALQKANADARFLICYISPKPKGKGVGVSRNNKIAIPNLLSPQFVKVANKKPLGKKQADSTGSCYVWICNGDNDSTTAAEIQTAMKRLKVKPPTSSSGKKKKSKEEAPILAIVYPASAIDPSKPTRLKVTPRVLAQHHCHPPPTTAESLIAWTSTIRKRHLREYAKLQHDRKEARLLEERNKGYVSSMKEDAERQMKEEQELKLKKEEEEKERMRMEQLEQRRKELLESLPEEPELGTDGAITIALRFSDGSRDQRRFMAAETSMNDVFNWIDAVHKMEREKVVLTTMNGQKSFAFVNEDGEESEDGDASVTLEEAGLGKMTALRVSEIVEEKDDDDKDEAEGDESDDDSE